MLIDIHSHINNERFNGETEAVISRAKNSGVGKIVCVGCNKKTSLEAIRLANEFDCVYASIGFHPNDVYDFDKEFEEILRSAKDNKKIVAIGEIGLDYFDFDWQLEQIRISHNGFSPTKEEFVEKQKQVFLRQLEIASELSLPVMIHMRDATSDTLKILENNKNFVRNGGVMHCFSGSLETANRVFALGLYLSIGGSITFKNSRVMPSVLEEIGISRITLETDCPYLCPEPFRGQRNEPKNIPIIARRIASIVGTSEEEVEKTTTENALAVFPRLGQEKHGKI